MSTLLTALTAYYASKTPAVSVPVGIRQDLGLPATVLGYSNDAAGLERYDADSALRVKARIPGVKNELEGVAGNFDWESNSDVVDLAADAVRFRVLGDMALKAIRTDPAYRQVAADYFSQAKDAIKAAQQAMADSLAPPDKVSKRSNPASFSIPTTFSF
jgi:hypothetical protein